MYTPDPKRYDSMNYNRCGASGIKLPQISLGLWHNFGASDDYENAKRTNGRSLKLSGKMDRCFGFVD